MPGGPPRLVWDVGRGFNVSRAAVKGGHLDSIRLLQRYVAEACWKTHLATSNVFSLSQFGTCPFLFMIFGANFPAGMFHLIGRKKTNEVYVALVSQ